MGSIPIRRMRRSHRPPREPRRHSGGLQLRASWAFWERLPAAVLWHFQPSGKVGLLWEGLGETRNDTKNLECCRTVTEMRSRLCTIRLHVCSSETETLGNNPRASFRSEYPTSSLLKNLESGAFSSFCRVLGLGGRGVFACWQQFPAL